MNAKGNTSIGGVRPLASIHRVTVCSVACGQSKAVEPVAGAPLTKLPLDALVATVPRHQAANFGITQHGCTIRKGFFECVGSYKEFTFAVTIASENAASIAQLLS
jgi:hypothetical protein